MTLPEDLLSSVELAGLMDLPYSRFIRKFSTKCTHCSFKKIAIGLNKEEIAEEIWKHEDALNKAELEVIVGEALKKQ